MKLFAIRFFAALLATAAIWDGTALGQDSWRRVTARDGTFTVEMPGEPAYITRDVKTDNGVFVAHRYIAQVGGTDYVVQFTIAPPNVDLSDTRKVLQSALDGVAKQLRGGTWENVRWTTYQGLTACDAIGVKNDGTAMRVFSVIKRRTQFNLLYARKGAAVAADADRFIGSFLAQ